MRKYHKEIVSKKELAIILNYISDDLDKLHQKVDIIERQINIIERQINNLVNIFQLNTKEKRHEKAKVKR